MKSRVHGVLQGVDVPAREEPVKYPAYWPVSSVNFVRNYQRSILCSAENYDPSSKDRFEENPNRTRYKLIPGIGPPGQQAMPYSRWSGLGDFAVLINADSESFLTDSDQMHSFAPQRFLRSIFFELFSSCCHIVLLKAAT